MISIEEQERLIEIERKRLDVLLIHEEAQLAKQEKVLEKKHQAKNVRIESTFRKKQIEQKKIEQLQENKAKVEELIQVLDNVREAKQKTVEENQKLGKQGSPYLSIYIYIYMN